MTHAFREVAKKARIEGASFHALRHTAATWMVRGGVDARSAADILGHSTPSTTLAIYSHAIASAKVAAVSTIDGRLAASKDAQGHRMVTGAASDSEKTLAKQGSSGSPNGIRTRVTAVRGRRPRPLDDRATWLPGMDSNHDKQVQSLLSYR